MSSTKTTFFFVCNNILSVTSTKKKNCFNIRHCSTMLALQGISTIQSNNYAAQFYTKIETTIKILRENECKYLLATNVKQENINSNDKFWNNVLCEIEKYGMRKLNNLNLKKQEIENDEIWMKYQYKLDKEGSKDEYLKIPQPQQSNEVEWKDIKTDCILRTGLKNDKDPKKAYINNIKMVIRNIQQIENENEWNMDNCKLLTDILSNFSMYLHQGGRPILLLNQSGWTFEDIEENNFNLSQISPNYGITAIIRKELFAKENKENNYHEGITGAQNIIGSPFMSTNLHKEHGNMKFATYSWTGHKLWIAVKEKKKGILAKLFKYKTNVDCC